MSLLLAGAAGAAASRDDVLDVSSGTIEMGLLLPLSRPAGVNGTAPFQSHVVAAQLALATVNASPLLLPSHTLTATTLDTWGDPYEAALRVDDLVRDPATRPPVLVGPTHASAAYGVATVARHRGANVISVSSAAHRPSDANSTLSTVRSSAGHEVRLILDFVEEAGWSQVVLVRGDSDESAHLTDVLKAEAEARGVSVPLSVQFPRDSYDAGAFLDTLRGSSDAPRVVVMAVRLTDYPELFEEISSSELVLSRSFYVIGPQLTLDDTTVIEQTPSSEVHALSRETMVVAPASGVTINSLSDADPATQLIAMQWIGALFAAATGASAEEIAALPEETLFTVQLSSVDTYNAVMLAATALHTLLELRDGCEAPFRNDTDACAAYHADGGDAASLVRLVRTVEAQGFDRTVRLCASGASGGALAATQFVRTESDAAGAIDGYANVAFKTLVAFSNGSASQLADSGLLFPGGVPPPDRAAVVNADAAVDPDVRAALTALAATMAAAAVAATVATVALRHTPVMRLSSYRLSCVSAAGGVLWLSVVLLQWRAPGNRSCEGEAAIPLVGFALLLAPVMAKAWRVHKIFSEGARAMSVVRVTDRQLMLLVAQVVAAHLILFVLFAGLGDVSARQVWLEGGEPQPTADPNIFVARRLWDCGSDDYTALVFSSLVTRLALLSGCSFLAFRTRDVDVPELNDSKNIALVIYTSLVVTVVVEPSKLLIGREELDTYWLLVTLFPVLMVSLVLALVFVPSVLGALKGRNAVFVTGAAAGKRADANTAVARTASSKSAAGRSPSLAAVAAAQRPRVTAGRQSSNLTDSTADTLSPSLARPVRVLSLAVEPQGAAGALVPVPPPVT